MKSMVCGASASERSTPHSESVAGILGLVRMVPIIRPYYRDHRVHTIGACTKSAAQPTAEPDAAKFFTRFSAPRRILRHATIFHDAQPVSPSGNTHLPGT